MTTLSGGSIRHFLWLSIAGLVFLGGCGPAGPKVAPVTGKVTYQGKGVGGATVSFYLNGSGTPNSGITKDDGTYVITAPNKGAEPGENVITVVKYKAAAAAAGPGDSMEAAAAKTGAEAPKSESELPERYGSVATSPLKKPVKEGKNDIPLDLED